MMSNQITFKTIATVVVALTLQSCQTTTLSPDSTADATISKTEHQWLGSNCLWGSEKLDLCDLQTKEEIALRLVNEMTLDEKLGQMTQSVWHNGVSPEIVAEFGIGSIIHTEGPTPGKTAKEWRANFNRFQEATLNTRLGVPLISAVDAVHGQNTFEGAVIFPHNIGMAATQSSKLIRQAASITAAETKATGFHWSFAPCISMPRHEFWGRVYEGFGEDSVFAAEAASASVMGLQNTKDHQILGVAATAKHFLGDGAAEGGVSGGDAKLSEDELAQRYLPPYQAAIDAGVASIMVGFNSVNGVNMHQNQELVKETLKKKMGFEGVVLTDWNGGLRYGPAHTVINAGVDLAMQPGNHKEFIDDLRSSVKDGTVSMERINDAVTRIIKLKLKVGAFKQPLFDEEDEYEIGSQENRAVARQAVRDSLVLLKNQNKALPLSAEDKIVVVGEHGNNTGLQSGGWSIHWQGQTENYEGATTIFEGILAENPNSSFQAGTCNENTSADTAVVVVGELPYAEFKGDTDQLWLSDAHKSLIQSCTQHVKNTVVLLISGRALEVTEQIDQADAFIAAWLPGSEGAGVADFLFAKDGYKPKGRLPHVWPKHASDLPLEIGDERALFPFGFGLESF